MITFKEACRKNYVLLPKTRKKINPPAQPPSRSPRDLAHIGFPLAYRGLGSLVCSDFDDTNNITVDEGNLTFGIATEPLLEEIKEVPLWSPQLKKLRHMWLLGPSIQMRFKTCSSAPS